MIYILGKRVMCVGGASHVFELTSELKQGSCLLQLLRKIYLYLPFDAFNPLRAQVTVLVGKQRGRNHQGPK